MAEDGVEIERRRGGRGHGVVTYNDCNMVFSAHEPPRYYHQSVPMALLKDIFALQAN